MSKIENQDLMFCATKLERGTLQTLKNIAFNKRITLKDLLGEILTEYAKKHVVTA